MDTPIGVAERLATAVTTGDFDRALELISPDAIDHAPLPGAATGRAGWRQKWQNMASVAAGVRIDVAQRVTTGDAVATRYTIRAEATDEPLGYALDMIRVRDGLIVEHWALPLPEPAAADT